MAYFMKEQGLAIHQNVPAIANMNIRPMDTSNHGGEFIGQIVSGIVNKFAEHKMELTNLDTKMKLEDMDNKFNLEVLSDPNLMNTEEGRKHLFEQYNVHLVE